MGAYTMLKKIFVYTYAFITSAATFIMLVLALLAHGVIFVFGLACAAGSILLSLGTIAFLLGILALICGPIVILLAALM